MVYAKLVKLPMVATSAPATPGTEDRWKGSVSCQHSKAELLFFVTIVLRVR